MNYSHFSEEKNWIPGKVLLERNENCPKTLEIVEETLHLSEITVGMVWDPSCSGCVKIK